MNSLVSSSLQASVERFHAAQADLSTAATEAFKAGGSLEILETSVVGPEASEGNRALAYPRVSLVKNRYFDEGIALSITKASAAASEAFEEIRATEGVTIYRRRTTGLLDAFQAVLNHGGQTVLLVPAPGRTTSAA